jgi:TldD protein
MADVALNAARSKGATYTDVRIGRYLNQYVVTREDKVQNIVDTQSYGMGIRVLAGGCWGFRLPISWITIALPKRRH